MISYPDDPARAVLPYGTRKLIAVVSADMVGYSRLIGLDDADTFTRLRELRTNFFLPAAERHGGVLLSNAGDALLGTFDSTIAAVRFAVEVQRGVPDFDGDYPIDRRLRFRVGVNIGDVIPDGSNMHGDGVNIAARLQTVCPPGGICVSRVVRDQVSNRLGLSFKELGAIDFKNISQPIEAFLLELAPPAALPLLAPGAPPMRRRLPWIATAAFGTVAAMLIYYGVAGLPFRSSVTPPRETSAALPPQNDLPPLSIAVLPFENLSGDAEQAYLADGISEDLTTDLSHLDDAFVISRESAFSFRGKSTDVRDIGRQLGVRYLLEGSVRKIGAMVRITAQLVATDTGAHLWAEHFDKPVKELGDGQDDIVERIAAALNVRMINVESARRARSQSGTPAAFDLVLHARSVLLEPYSQDRDFIALGMLLQALRVDPNSVPAMAGVAAMFAGRARGFAGYYRIEVIKRATQLVEAAERRAPNLPDVLVAKFLLLQTARRNAEALAAYRHLLGVDASVTSTILQLGICCWTDDPEAIPLLRKTVQVNPRTSGVGIVRIRLAHALLLANRAEDARDALLQALAQPPLQSPTPTPVGEDPPGERWRNSARLFLAIADVQTNRVDEAQSVVKEVMTAPSMREASVHSFMRDLREYEDADKVAQERRFGVDLRQAGLRDHLDEDVDSGVASTSTLQDVAHSYEPTPMDIPGGHTVRTPDVIKMLATLRPLVLTTSSQEPTIPRAIYVDLPETGNLQDSWEANLRRVMEELTQGDRHRPIIVFSFNINRWLGRNLALRLIALGYTDVNWYRGGWEAWEASGQPRGPLAERRIL